MKKVFRILITILLAALCITSIFWYFLIYDTGLTRDLLIREAKYCNSKGYTNVSAWFYNLAYSHSGNDKDVIDLANQYKQSGNYTKAESTLTTAISMKPSVELYIELSNTFVEQDKLMDAVNLLASIPDAQIRAEIDKIRPLSPSASQLPGFYSQYISVELISTNTIYYSVNGDYPSNRTSPYSSPIQLQAGETIIRAISVGGNGLVSPVSILGYTVGGVVEPVDFLDPDLEDAVRSILNVDSSKILYTNDLWSITELNVPNSVWTLEDLALLTHLKKLTINNLNIPSLHDISGLSELEYLNLSGCRFSSEELAVVAGLPALKELVLENCGLSTIASLQGAQNLTLLNLNRNSLRNLEVLKQMSNLRELYINHNAVTSLDAILSLMSLEKLDISYNSVDSLAPIGVCVKLSWLNAANNQLTNANGLSSLPLLSSLALDFNQISDIGILANCQQLRELTISNNNITDLSALTGLTNLVLLDCSYNAISALPSWTSGSLQKIEGSHNTISDISSLAVMQDLTYVSLDYNAITDISCLANCNNLVQVNVYGNSIESVAELTSHNIIVNYNPTLS